MDGDVSMEEPGYSDDDVPEYHQHECGWGLFAGKEAGQQQQDWEDDHVYSMTVCALPFVQISQTIV
jgi:hypothetical protein